jgi:subfamily B ATP-binding cassette protein MsbA
MEQLIPYFFLLIMYLTVMAIISWQLTAIVIAIFPILSYLIRRFVEKIKKTSAQYADAYEALSSKVSNIISAMILVKLYSKQSAESKHFEKISNKIEDTEFNIDKMQNAVGPIQEVAVLALVIIVISAMACIIAQGDTKHIAGFLVYFYLLKRSQYVIGVLNNMRASFAVISGPLMVIWETFKDENKFIIKDGKKKFSGLKKAIELRHLRFFHGDKEILKDITGTIEQGKVTAILGPTGSGKTTVINLIMYLYESPPVSIIIDGVDIRDFTEQSLREHIAVVSQEVALFNDTIKNNIIYGLDHEISDKELADVLKKARLQEFIKNLPKGLDSHIGDRGVMISGGEKQKISLARALLKNAEILILDEATSSIDAESECQIREGVAEAIKNRTSIIIAHHLRMVQHADNIIVIEKGQTVEEGPPDKLLEKKGKFYAYWQRDKYF